ncbi:beta-ketoacyl-[acyl-carrier-protein] synthase family protein [Streptomyces solincola]|uniref:beta-ketoacyl-[acyl-carrier-protein] synthase family protein n=1 Tax=Streptomyces solincola TaxID=2100817 RepID=UPI00215904D4|nr:beta-ketoacyl-[acyl-carrier-protein] synthase family protein [Streptomyces solincola]
MTAAAGGAGVTVTGLGMVTPAGIGAAATWDGLLAGAPTAATDPVLAGLHQDFCCRVPGFDAHALLGRRLAWRLDRGTHLALVAAREAVADAGLDPADWPAPRVAVVMGVGTCSFEHYEREFARAADGRPETVSPFALPRSIPNMVPGEIGLDLGAQGPNLAVSTACASGTTALGVARDLLRSGSCDIVLAGGAESVCHRIPAICFGQMGALSGRRDDPAHASRPFDRGRDGFVLGEGAAVLVLERADHARARGARALAHLAGYGASCDAHHVTSPHPDGRGLAQAVHGALAAAGLRPEDVDHVNAHGTSTPYNDEAEARALHAVFPRTPPVTALKSVLGHSIGGAGAIEAAATVLALRHQVVPPTANLDDPDPALDLDIVAKVPRPLRMRAALSTSSGFGGQNAAVVLTAEV